jgi:hypothetical protein
MAITHQHAFEKPELEQPQGPVQGTNSEVIIEITRVEPNLEPSQVIAQIFPCR